MKTFIANILNAIRNFIFNNMTLKYREEKLTLTDALSFAHYCKSNNKDTPDVFDYYQWRGRFNNKYGLSGEEWLVKERIGVLLELLGEDTDIICAINGYLDGQSGETFEILNKRIQHLQKETGNYGPYIAEPIQIILLNKNK